MNQRVAVVDYGMGNLFSVAQAARRAAQGTGWEVQVTAQPEDVMRAQRVILPGQGAMRDCMHELDRSGLRAAVLHAAAHKPLLGVCVGMQMLLTASEEGPSPGLDLIPGQVRRFQLHAHRQPDGQRYKVPQMGWNQVWPTQPHAMWDGVAPGAYFYFVHSYYADPQNAQHSAACTEHGLRFTSAIARDNIFATQFHPEKSAEQGLALYRNFLHWQP